MEVIAVLVLAAWFGAPLVMVACPRQTRRVLDWMSDWSTTERGR